MTNELIDAVVGARDVLDQVYCDMVDSELEDEPKAEIIRKVDNAQDELADILKILRPPEALD